MLLDSSGMLLADLLGMLFCLDSMLPMSEGMLSPAGMLLADLLGMLFCLDSMLPMSEGMLSPADISSRYVTSRGGRYVT
jgi:hypothetical protein